ncbi:methionine adenosyltransferase [Paenibacillus sp. FSL H7-0716]|uniref:S-adenosylmethionine synthetase n=1 Tax=Paenibacillus odorifer TaxID=189426 RepID=A0AB36JKG8_9BACL|nr:methionine adenosyltransferase [Paenibacillus odorifer]OME23562.1 S-adenosylmethionine synthetase [Paenibacillus odorifer]
MIHIIKDKKTNIEKLSFELVERKGVGHPDTICDAIAERASRYYSQYFMDTYGRVAHHWFDKVMLIGGLSQIEFGRGELIKPYKVIFAGKGAKTYSNDNIPLYNILFKAAKDVLGEVLTGFDATKHLVVVDEIVNYHGAGRSNSRYQPMILEDLASLDRTDLVSNDCNLLSSYTPLSTLEMLVLYTEQYINGKLFKERFPETGWDVKLVGSREYEEYKLLINLPFIAGKVDSVDTYFQLKNQIYKDIMTFIYDNFAREVQLTINPQDKNGKYYLTALGSVADTGDVGVVGRGNRINGLICPMRSMSIEAPSGKNPLDHTGKIYGYLGEKLSKQIYQEIGKPNEVHIFTSKEAPLEQPDHVSVHIQDWDDNELERENIRRIVEESLREVHGISGEFIYGDITMW